MPAPTREKEVGNLGEGFERKKSPSLNVETIRERDPRVKDFGETEGIFSVRRVCKWVSRQKEMLGQPVQHLGPFHLCFEKRDNRSHPVPEDLPDFL
jgi:hypothetical protein